MIERAGGLSPVEIKSGQTIASDYLAGLAKWRALAGPLDRAAWLVYGGDTALRTNNVEIVPWRSVPALAEQL